MDNEVSLYLSRVGLTFPGTETTFESSQYIFFGVPFDSGSSSSPGSRYGPKAVREVIQGMELWSEYFKVDLEDISIYDAGDLWVSHGDAQATASALKKVVSKLVSLGKVPVMVGGEHTFTPFAAVSAGADSLLVYDAHADCRKDYLGNPLSHACATRLWIESKGTRVFQVGIRATSREERRYCEEMGIIQFSPFQVNSDSFRSALKEFVEGARSLYVSIDMDAFDPAYAPGVGTPEPFGLSPVDVLKTFEVISGANLVGFDVMELCPLRDPSYSSSALAAKLITEMYASRLQRKQVLKRLWIN
ncbi:MAG: agmatinase [Thermoprotei archaeon]|jgi:agmatinase